ncbi:MAG: ATP-binding protein [Planctomycetota bacterium]|nr:ATP-binding protein [Planctomycetota bacterium]
MNSPKDESTLSRAIDLLLDCGSPTARAGILLDAVLKAGLAQAGSLWRRVGTGEVRAWHPLLSRGEAACLPTLAQVEAVTSGELDKELGARRLVLTPVDDQDFALALGEVDGGEWDLSELEALLAIWSAIERAEDLGTPSLLDALPGPSPKDAQPAPDELTAMLAEALDPQTFAEFFGPLDPSPTAFEEILEFEVARLLGPDTQLDFQVDQTPQLALDEEALEDLVRNLLEGLDDSTRRIRIQLSASDQVMPGALLVIESDSGWPPSLGGLSRGRSQGSGRELAGLSLAVADLHRCGGSMRLERSTWGGLQTTCWLPASGS